MCLYVYVCVCVSGCSSDRKSDLPRYGQVPVGLSSLQSLHVNHTGSNPRWEVGTIVYGNVTHSKRQGECELAGERMKGAQTNGHSGPENFATARLFPRLQAVVCQNSAQKLTVCIWARAICASAACGIGTQGGDLPWSSWAQESLSDAATLGSVQGCRWRLPAAK